MHFLPIKYNDFYTYKVYFSSLTTKNANQKHNEILFHIFSESPETINFVENLKINTYALLM